jgi:hypothetical protein
MSDKVSILPAQFVFRMVGSAALGERVQTVGPLGGRYMSTATGGGRFEGPSLRGELLEGFAWGPHRMRGSDYGHMHYDVRVLLKTDDGHHILMRYRGVNSPTYGHRNWRIAPVFEAECGPYSWLDRVQGVGLGRVVGSDVEYMIYALSA